MSYRDAGVALLARDGQDVSITATSFKNPALPGIGFHALQEAARNLTKTVIEIKDLINNAQPNIVVIEMPCFTQSSKAALVIGMCWGCVGDINANFIEPSMLKRWSGSKRGDKKAKVKEKVLNRAIIPQEQISNDNIIDAVGIALMTSDFISQEKYDNANQ